MAGQPEIQPRKRGRPTAEERRARESEILSNVLCVFLHCGYGASTVDELAAAAQVTKRTRHDLRLVSLLKASSPQMPSRQETLLPMTNSVDSPTMCSGS